MTSCAKITDICLLSVNRMSNLRILNLNYCSQITDKVAFNYHLLIYYPAQTVIIIFTGCTVHFRRTASSSLFEYGGLESSHRHWRGKDC